MLPWYYYIFPKNIILKSNQKSKQKLLRTYIYKLKVQSFRYHLPAPKEKKKKNIYGLPKWRSGKESPAKAGNTGWIPGSGKFPGGGNGDPLQDSCLGNPMDRRTFHGVEKESDMT